MKQPSKMQYKILGYFALFFIMVFATLWTLQIVFFNSFYEQMKVKEVQNVAKNIISEYGSSSFDEKAFEHSFRSGFMIRVFDEAGLLKNSPNIFQDFNPHRRDRWIMPLINKVKENKGAPYIDINREPGEMGYRMITYISRLDEGKYLIIQAPLTPTNTSISVIKLQLTMVTFLTALLALLLSFIVSARLSKPIKEMTKSSAKLAEGDYSVKFSGGGYYEANQLSEALNYATSELSKTDQLRKDLVANVSHDLKTPLTIIKSYSEMIRDISGNSEEKRNQHIEVIINESDRMSQLITDILDISRMESALTAAKKEVFNLSETLQSVYEAFTVITDYKDFDFSIEAEEDIYVAADSNMIRRVIYNLLSNAAKFTGTDKKVSVKLFEKDGNARVEIKDTGKGIPENELKLVWDKYMQSSMSHHRSSQGTGLGLSIVKQILLLHRAKFGVKSKLNEGSVFWFELKRSI